MRKHFIKRVIDYIFFFGDFKLVAQSKLPDAIDEKGLPSQDFPSDHLYLYAIFGLNNEFMNNN